MLKKKWLWILAVVVAAAAAGGGYYTYTISAKSATATSTTAAMQTTVARRGDLVVTASGTGKIAATTQFGVGFDETGTLIELLVGVGDKVEANAVLARLQTEDTPEEIAASISDAELVVIQKQQALDDLYANAEIARTEAMSDISTYAQEVRDAQYQMENYSMPVYLQGMDAVEALDKMKEALDAASAAFEPYKYYPVTHDMRYDLLVKLNEAQSSYNAAVKRLEYEYALQVAQANMDKARQEYEQYKDGPAASDLALAQAELKNAQDKLALAKEAQSIVELTAPIAGTVMSIDASVGETLNSATVITLADLSHPQVEAYLDESDLDKVQLGNEAEVVFDALPDQTFKGTIVTVSPGLETVSNVQAVKVIVRLEDGLEDGATNISLPVGLTASVDIIAGRAENAVLVPIEALCELDTNEYGIFVVEDGLPALRVVQVGLQDITDAEIISGIEAGETVSTGITKTQ